jgi:hypothetical protein
VKTTTKKNILRLMLAAVSIFALVVTTTVRGEDAKTQPEADPNEYNNWITLGVGSPFIRGDEGAFSARHQMGDKVFGGIEDLHWEQSVGKQGLFELNGHGIFDEHNYSVDLKLSDPDKGYISVGYEQFRTWYDNSGGYYPGGTNRWFELPYDLAVDRGRAWFEAGLTLPDVPQITFRYDHEFREGNKASTIWGDANVSGTAGVYPAPTGTSPTTRNFVPTFLGIDEQRDIFSLKVKHTIGKTDFTVGGSYEHLDNDNTRNIHRRPGEIAGATAQQRADRYVTERQKLEEDLFSAHAVSETRFSDKVKLTVGGLFATLDTDIGGSRIYGNQYDPVLGPYLRTQQRDSGYFGVVGGGSVKQYVANLNLMLAPLKNLVIVPSVRFEQECADGFALYLPTTVNSAGGPLVTNALTRNTADRGFLEVTEALEARYSGLKNWSFYTRLEWSQACEDRNESTGDSKWERFGHKYTVGANWFTLPRLNMGGQYYYKISDNRLDDSFNTDWRYFETHDLNYRLTWRPLSQLSFVTRYDFQLSTAQHKDGTLPEVEAAKMTSHIISESINWTPISRMYVQLNGSYAWDGALTTPVDGAAAFGATNPVPNLDNSYWIASAILGYALDEQTDLTLQYNFYRADNYVNNYLWSQPYGANAEEHGITATVSRQLNKRTRVSLKYGYFTADDNTSGDHNNYDAHLIYATLQYRF